MKKSIKVLYVPVGEEPYIMEIENRLDALQKAVGGYIETFNLDNLYGEHAMLGAIAILNEEGKLTPGIKPNRNVYYTGRLYDTFYGNFFVCGVDEEGDLVSVTPEQEDYYRKTFSLMSASQLRFR